MIFVFLDDNTLDIHDDAANLNGWYEAIDVGNGEFSFFDSEGFQLIPHFQQRTVRKKLFGLIPYSVDGLFHLVRGEQRNNELHSRLNKVAAVNENSWFKTKEDIFAFLSDKKPGV